MHELRERLYVSRYKKMTALNEPCQEDRTSLISGDSSTTESEKGTTRQDGTGSDLYGEVGAHLGSQARGG
jgi:hypothetical protein